jgi:hypothetical protein
LPAGLLFAVEAHTHIPCYCNYALRSYTRHHFLAVYIKNVWQINQAGQTPAKSQVNPNIGDHRALRKKISGRIPEAISLRNPVATRKILKTAVTRKTSRANQSETLPGGMTRKMFPLANPSGKNRNLNFLT